MLKRHWVALSIALVLAVVPFFWFPPGAVDLGGDGGRLYFYEPRELVKHLGPYYVWPQDAGFITAPFSRLPFFHLVATLSTVVPDMHTLASLHNAAKLSVGFLSVYAIIRLLSGGAAGGLLGGLLYVFNPAMTENYIRALPSHDQVFLNPLMTYLMLLLVLTGKLRFGIVAVIVSVIFSHVYSYTSAPPFFAFYPLAVLFSFVYVAWVRKRRIAWRSVFLALVILFGAHAFHLIPEAYDLLDSANRTTSRVFDKTDAAEQVTYFVSVLPIPKVSLRLLAASLWMPWIGGSVILPLMIVAGCLLVSSRSKKTLSLVGLFTLLTLFLTTAKVSNVAVEAYKQLFLIVPGFSMFRNFYGQWQFVFFFFFSVFFGLAAASLFARFNRIATAALTVLVAALLTVRAIPFLTGEMVNQKNHLSVTRVGVVMDPNYATMLAFIRSLPQDGKILTLPFTDCCYQVIYGTNDGAYVGRSLTGYLTGKHDFSGYDAMLPFSETFWRLSREKDYEGIKRLLGMLNIRYVLYNSDPRVYDTTFPSYPYEYARKFLPDTQQGYRSFVESIVSKKLFSVGTFELYEGDDAQYLPLFYAADSVRTYTDDPGLSEYAKAEAFFNSSRDGKQTVYGEETGSEKTLSDLIQPVIRFRQVNPTKYVVSVSGATKPYVLVMLMRYNAGWKVYSDMVQLAGNAHFRVNGYANAWLIRPEDTQGRDTYELTIELSQQRLFGTGLAISVATVIATVVFGMWSRVKSYSI